MAWIEAHQALRDHPKVSDLAVAMDWPRYEAVGRLFIFWWWCLDYAEDGDLRGHNDARLGSAVGLNEAEMGKNGVESGKFVKAMIRATFIDKRPYRRVHDWWDYIGNYLQSKYKRSPERWQRVRDLYLPCTGYVPVTTQGTQPDTNLPTNKTNINIPTNHAGFEEFWHSYPKKVSKHDALKAWSKLKPDPALQRVIVTAVDQQRHWPQWTKDGGNFIPYPATWLNGRRWEDAAPPEAAYRHEELPVRRDDLTPAQRKRLKDLTSGIGRTV